MYRLTDQFPKLIDGTGVSADTSEERCRSFRRRSLQVHRLLGKLLDLAAAV